MNFEIASKSGSIDNEEDIAFQIAPRINAAGRMETAKLPVELLLCKNKDLAKEMAEKLIFLTVKEKEFNKK